MRLTNGTLPLTVTATGVETALRPCTSYALAVSDCPPALGDGQTNPYGVLGALPIKVAPAKKSTRPIAPSGESAVALSVSGELAGTVLPGAGAVITTAGRRGSAVTHT